MAHELAHVVQQANRTKLSPAPAFATVVHDGAADSATDVSRYDRSAVATTPHGAPSLLQESDHPMIMRMPVFTSTMEICHRQLESRVFNVSQGGIRVTANAAYQRRGTPECSNADYHMTLNQKGYIFDSGYGTCEFPQGRPFSRQWTDLPSGDYSLVIWTNNTNRYCCLVGDIIVDQMDGLQGESCTEAPAGPLEILHSALDVVGLIPVVGVVADGANLIIYVAEGDWVNAGISAAAMAPIVGGAAVLGRAGRRVVRVSGEAIERRGRDRIVAGLRRTRRPRRPAGGSLQEAGEGGRRRIFAKRKPPAGDSLLDAGEGHTDKFVAI